MTNLIRAVLERKIERIRKFLKTSPTQAELDILLGFSGGCLSVEIITLLLNAGGDPNSPHQKSSPLLEAVGVLGTPPEVVELLLSGSANPNYKNQFGVSVLQRARETDLFAGEEIIQLLLDAGAEE